MTIINPNQEAADTIAKNINKYMNHYKISRKELAKRLNVTPSTVGYWCTGKKIPRMSKIDEMCKIFHIQRKHIVSDQPVRIGRVMGVKVSDQRMVPKLSLTAQKSEPLPKISDARPQAIGEMSHEEENLIRMYRAEMYGDIITLMVDKMKEKRK